MELGRRELLAGLAALGVPLPARAAALNIPLLDSLALTVVVDKETFGPFLPDRELPGLAVRYAGSGGGRSDPAMRPRALAGEFGLSILAEAKRGAERRQILVDFGYSADVLRNNLELLGIDPQSLDATALSHGHLDHYGGFPALFAGGRPTRPVPLHVGGEETFCERVAMIGTPPPLMGTLDRDALAGAGLAVRIAPEPELIGRLGFTTGTIPLETFERVAIPTRMRPGKGCARIALPAAKRSADELVDDGEHELATCFALKDRGLVVIASCSHRGVINSVRRAQAISGISRVHLVIGGFHLVRPRTEEEAGRTAVVLAELNPAYLVPMHCTGELFIAEAMRLMPDKVIRPYVGTRLEMS